jgi:hypothetical protein
MSSPLTYPSGQILRITQDEIESEYKRTKKLIRQKSRNVRFDGYAIIGHATYFTLQVMYFDTTGDLQYCNVAM